MSSEPTPPSPAEVSARRTRSHGDLFAGLVVFLIALYVLIEAIGMPQFGRRRPELSAPGLTPMLLAIGLMILSALLCLRSWRATLSLPRLRFTMESLRVGIVVAILVAYIVLLPAIGYVAATFLMLLSFQSAFAPKWTLRYLLVWCLGLSIMLTGTLWYVFARVFLIPIP